MSCLPTLQNTAVYLQKVSIDTSSNLSYDYLVTGLLPSAQPFYRVVQFTSQGSLTGPITSSNSTLTLDFTEAHRACPRYNISFQGALNGTLILHNQVFSANKYMSYTILHQFKIQLKFDKFPRSIVECYGPTSTQPFFFQIGIQTQPLLPNTFIQPAWLNTCVFPVLTSKNSQMSSELPTQLSSAGLVNGNAQQAKAGVDTSGFYLLNGQCGTSGGSSPFEETDFSSQFVTYYSSIGSCSDATQIKLADMGRCRARISAATTVDEINRIGTRSPNIVDYYKNFSEANLLLGGNIPADSIPQHFHINTSLSNNNLSCGIRVQSNCSSVDNQTYQQNCRTQKQPTFATHPTGTVLNINNDPMKYNVAQTGYVLNSYVVANDAMIPTTPNDPTYMRVLQISSGDGFLFLSCANKGEYYSSSSGISNLSQYNDYFVASVEYPVRTDGTINQELFKNLYPQYGIGVPQINLTLHNLINHTHEFKLYKIGGATSEINNDSQNNALSNQVSTLFFTDIFPSNPPPPIPLPTDFNYNYLSLNKLASTTPTLPSFFPTGTILMMDGTSPLLEIDPTTGKFTFKDGRKDLLFCDGSLVAEPEKYPLLSQLLVDNKLPDFTTYGNSMYMVGGPGGTDVIATQTNQQLFDPLLTNGDVDNNNPISNYTRTYTVFQIVEPIVVSALCDKFGISLETLKRMNTTNPPKITGDPNQVLQTTYDGALGVVANFVCLPNIPSVLTQLYLRLPNHSHTYDQPITDGCLASSNGFFPSTKVPKNIELDAQDFNTGMVSGEGTYESFNGYPSTLAVVYVVVADYTP